MQSKCNEINKIKTFYTSNIKSFARITVHKVELETAEYL